MSSDPKSSEIHIDLGFQLIRMRDEGMSWLLVGREFTVKLPVAGWKQTFFDSYSNWFDSHYTQIEYPLSAEVNFSGKDFRFTVRGDTDLENLCRLLKDPILLMSEGDGEEGTTARRLLAALNRNRRAE